ncbi:MAG: hypothetical protein NUV96_01490, partial [Candidatus Colwellbacteria bacterium]|nr:hypothetical protein [Candidatus Colwellbacteria bacterium]
NDSQYQNWEAGIRAWLIGNPNPTRFPTATSGSEELVAEGGDLEIRFMSPSNGDKVNKAFVLRARISGDNDITNAKVYLDNSIMAEYSGNYGKSFSIREDLVGGDALQSRIQIEVGDEEGNTKSKEIIVFF